MRLERPGAAAGDAARRPGGTAVRICATGRPWTPFTTRLAYDSMLSECADPQRAPELLTLRERIRSWRFYDQLRTDADAPARAGADRHPHPGARATTAGTWPPPCRRSARSATSRRSTPRSTGRSRGSRWRSRSTAAGSRSAAPTRPAAARWSAAELSDGTLRYLLWVAALLTPRPPELLVLNEPETSLHPDLLAHWPG